MSSDPPEAPPPPPEDDPRPPSRPGGDSWLLEAQAKARAEKGQVQEDDGDELEGYAATARAALDAGALGGMLLGLADGVGAAVRTGVGGVTDLLGCLAGSAFVHALVAVLGAQLLAPLLHPFLRARPLRARIHALLGGVLGVGLFLAIYWWSRPFVFPGLPAVDPRRLAAAVGMLALGLGLGAILVRLLRRLPMTTENVLSTLVLVIGAAGALYLYRQNTTREERGTVDERNRELPNVVLFVVDALRADTIGAYGDPETRTPHIDELARRGVLFENAFVQAPYTWTSFGSFLTGKYPRRHGLIKMAPGYAMAPSNETLATHFERAPPADGRGGRPLEPGDYLRAAFMTGTLSHGTGLLAGFDLYFEGMVGHELVDLSRPWSEFRSELLLYRTKNKLTQRLDPELVATTAVDWIRDNSHRRFLALVHFYSTHTPYDPPQALREEYLDPDYDGPIDSFYAEHRLAIERGDYEPTEADRERIRDLYQAGVTWADAMIGRVVEELERQNVLHQTLVIVTSDHGEELGEHGVWEHNWMYQTNLRIPLVMAYPPERPGGLPPGTRVDAIVDSIDLLPTICDVAGLAPPHHPEEPDGRGLVDGTSLLPLVRGEVDGVRPYSFAENGLYLSVQDRRWKLIVSSEVLETGDWTAGAVPHPARLFDLEGDPGEMHDALEEHPDQAERLLAALREWDEAMPIARYRVHTSARDEAQLLEQLGYVEPIGGEGEVEAGGDSGSR